ncbi:hypothetical protein M0R72_15175 [Candidatus Pacearchaeota archaeon]|jgi:hypothetical protein|nr:hypothetical protein [Candidatus Pacearchaeota archaeon]
MTMKTSSTQGLTVKDLINHLKTLPQDLPVYVRIQDPRSEIGYWLMTEEDISTGSILESETGKEFPAVVIGEDCV